MSNLISDDVLCETQDLLDCAQFYIRDAEQLNSQDLEKIRNMLALALLKLEIAEIRAH